MIKLCKKKEIRQVKPHPPRHASPWHVFMLEGVPAGFDVSKNPSLQGPHVLATLPSEQVGRLDAVQVVSAGALLQSTAVEWTRSSVKIQ